MTTTSEVLIKWYNWGILNNPLEEMKGYLYERTMLA